MTQARDYKRRHNPLPPSVTSTDRAYDSEAEEGARIWSQVQLALARRMPVNHAVAEDRYGKPILVHPRLGQGAFGMLVTVLDGTWVWPALVRSATNAAQDLPFILEADPPKS